MSVLLAFAALKTRLVLLTLPPPPPLLIIVVLSSPEQEVNIVTGNVIRINARTFFISKIVSSNNRKYI
jgi:hypothetical protein